MTPRWIVYPSQEPQALERLCREAGIHPLVAGILQRRGITDPAAAEAFFNPRLEHLHDPYLLKGMAAAVERIAAALAGGERIVVSGDYDVDGTTATAVLMRFLRSAGAAHPAYFIPNRFEHGYGLTQATTEALKDMSPDLVVTVDNGITAIDEVARLQGAGIDTIITDHHLPREAGVPEGIVLNPLQPGCQYPYKRISGCGVAFKLITALRHRLREQGWWNDARPEPNLKQYLGLVAIATVADIVPLTGENRVLTYHGLQVLNAPDRNPGVQALLALGSNGGNGENRPVTARTIGFQLGPRLNAAGRMTEGALATELLLADDPRRAGELATVLNRENENRRALGETMFSEAVRRIETEGKQQAAGIVVVSPEFHEGIIGIVASRLVERFHRPVLVLAQNGASCKGSARSIAGINVSEAISACAQWLQEYGGHAGAGGCTFPSEHLTQVESAFREACGRLADEAAPPSVFLDGKLDPDHIDQRLVEQVLRLEPFGHENEEPEFLLEQASLSGGPQVLKERHLKWRVRPGVDMVAWNRAAGFQPDPGLSYRVRVGFNEYRGRRTIQLAAQEISQGY